MSEQVDWLRSMALMGQYAGGQVQIAVDASGRLYAILTGSFGSTLVPVAVDTDGQLITVLRGESGNYLNVDASGFLTTLIKGEDAASALQTVRVDDNGRLSAFVIDSSDAWSQILKVGNAELAARLGSIVKYDRRGQTILTTDFSKGWDTWRTSTTGTGTTVALDPTVYREAGYSVKCTSGGISTASVYLFNWLPVLPLYTAGLAVYFSIPAEARYLDLVIQADDTVNRPQGRCRYDFDLEKLQIVNSSGSWVDVATGIPIKKHQQSFNYMKLVIDGDNDTYLRLLFNDQEIDLSAYDCWDVSTLDYAHLYLGVWAFMREDEADIVYLDCPVVTINEPT